MAFTPGFLQGVPFHCDTGGRTAVSCSSIEFGIEGSNRPRDALEDAASCLLTKEQQRDRATTERGNTKGAIDASRRSEIA